MEPITRAIYEEYERLSADLKDRVERCFAATGSGAAGDGQTPGSELLCLVRASAAVEQAFGGLNSQLWDDPYEWTLPEAMGSKERVMEYIAEVDLERRKGFERIRSDNDLTRDVWTPWGTMSLAELLIRTLSRARRLEGRSSGAVGP